MKLEKRTALMRSVDSEVWREVLEEPGFYFRYVKVEHPFPMALSICRVPRDELWVAVGRDLMVTGKIVRLPLEVESYG